MKMSLSVVNCRRFHRLLTTDSIMHICGTRFSHLHISSKTSQILSNSILDENQVNHLHVITSKQFYSFVIIMLVYVDIFCVNFGSLYVVKVDVGIELLVDCMCSKRVIPSKI